MRHDVRRDLDIVVRDGKPVAVMVPIAEYRSLLERIADAAGLSALQKAVAQIHRQPIQERTGSADSTNDDADSAMLDICREYTAGAPVGVVIREPYVPYIPDGWNGVLVLAIAQNMPADGGYVRYLQGLGTEDRYWRLYPERNPSSPFVRQQPGALSIGPWDSGDCQLGVLCLGFDPAHTAVSNGVPWSCRTSAGRDSPPTDAMQDAATAFWRQVFGTWQPERIIAFGRIPERVMQRAGQGTKCIYAPFPTGQAIAQNARDLDIESTLEAYPEIAGAFAYLGLDMTPDETTRRRMYVAKGAIDAARDKGWQTPDQLR